MYWVIFNALMVTIWNYYNAISCEQSTWSRILEAINLSLSEVITWKKSKNEIKRLSDRLDAIRHQQADLSLVEAADKYAELEKEKATLEAEIARLREVHSQKLSKEAQKLMKMPFQRAITKKSKLIWANWKSVRGLVVVHPMTALGREMGLQEMTGFSKTAF